MPQAQISGTPFICTFGGLAQPNGQGVLTNINLNDTVNWSLQDLNIDNENQVLGLAQQTMRGKAQWISQDFASKLITLPMWYSEVGGKPLGQALAQLQMAGEQQLSFDGATYILAKYRGIRSPGTYPRMLRKYSPILWEMQLEFLCREPWFKDLSSTTSSTTTLVAAPTAAPTGSALAGGSLATGTYTLEYTYVTASGETAPSPVSSGIVLTTGNQQISVGAVTLPSWATAVKWYFTGASPTTGFAVQNVNGNAFTLNTAGNGTLAPTSTPATAVNITYAGSIWTEPVWTLTIPNTNPNAVLSFVLTNTMSGEALTIVFPGNLAASTSYTFTIDSGLWTVVDGSGNGYDATGSFPELYGPAGQVNTFTAKLNGVSADPVGATLSATYTNRWSL